MEKEETTRPSRGSFAETLEILLTRRRLSLALVAFVTLHGILSLLALPSYRCPFHSTFGLPCPGCGLTRGMLALLRGQFSAMPLHHPFAPYVLFMGILMATAAFLRPPQRHRLAAAMAKVESRTHLHATILIGMLIFGLARLALCWVGAGR